MFVFFLMIRLPPIFTLFPYTTLFRSEGIEGIVLRYGMFYGPGTWYAKDGDVGRQVMKRRYPIIGKGEGTYSFIHVDDAARSEEHTSELQSRQYIVCRLLLEIKKLTLK